MSDFHIFRTEHDGLLIVQEKGQGAPVTLLIRETEVLEFYGRLSGALPLELRGAMTRPSYPPEQPHGGT